jgi:hypothetical protein
MLMHDRSDAVDSSSGASAPSRERFRSLLVELAAEIGARPLDAELERWLNAEHGPGTRRFTEIASSCLAGVDEGWMCARERGGIHYGRVFEPEPELRDFSVDVVDMADVVGPRHVHPDGEIDLVIPLTAGVRFDGRGAGWCVYPPASSHAPTVSNGRALVLYLLPHGRIDFSRAS